MTSRWYRSLPVQRFEVKFSVKLKCFQTPVFAKCRSLCAREAYGRVSITSEICFRTPLKHGEWMQTLGPSTRAMCAELPFFSICFLRSIRLQVQIMTRTGRAPARIPLLVSELLFWVGLQTTCSHRTSVPNYTACQPKKNSVMGSPCVFYLTVSFHVCFAFIFSVAFSGSLERRLFLAFRYLSFLTSC